MTVRRLLAVVAAFGVVMGLGCSDGGPSAEAVAEAEELAEAALLTEGDLPAGDWVVEELNLQEVDSFTPDPADWPEECGEEPVWEIWDEEEALVARGRRFMLGGSSDRALWTTVTVFESVGKFERMMERKTEEAEERRFTEECTTVLKARDASEGFESRSEEPRYGLRDVSGTRRISTFVTPSGATTEVMSERHVFVRGRVVAMYMIIESDESPREIDHQRLLEAFESRVVVAEE